MHKKPLNINFKTMMLMMAATMTVMSSAIVRSRVMAESCPDLRIVFARGSGAEQETNADYLDFRQHIDEKLIGTGISYEFIDLDYPAVAASDVAVAVGALLSGGESYAFGDSVKAGEQKLVKLVNGASCPDTKYVLGGYSQGAIVVARALRSVDADRIIYAATFGDPKLYLPEGVGIVPPACRGANLSDYRMYVPDCYAHEGLLGAYVPYEPEDLAGKLGTWCNKRDIFCSSHLNIFDHVSYVAEKLYEDASRVIASKVTLAFGVKNEYTSPHDTAILIDSTGSMSWLIDNYKSEAVRLANETFAAGGRVALYDYRDLGDPYAPVARCDFETCSAENFQSYLDNILVYGGGDEAESLLSASLNVMNELSWRPGATKSLVVLTDAPFLSPDRDETTMADVIDLSKRIDPVNMYIITPAYIASSHPEMTELAEATGGFLTSELGELDLLTDYIMERYDTLLRVEETLDDDVAPMFEITEVADDGEEVTIKFEGDATGAIVTLNDAWLGMVDGHEVGLTDLDRRLENTVRLIPINDSRKGEAVEMVLPVRSRAAAGEGLEAEPDLGSTVASNAEDALTDSTEPGVDAEAALTETVEVEQDVLSDTEPEQHVVESEADAEGYGAISGESGFQSGDTTSSEPEAKSQDEASVQTAPVSLIIPKAPDTGIIH